jgi:hypothetical protein
MTPQEFLAKYTPTPANQRCECMGPMKCLVCESVEVVKGLLGIKPAADILQEQLDHLTDALSPLQASLLSVLRQKKLGINTSRLAGIVYGDDPNGGPLEPEAAIRSLKKKLERRLRPYGWRIGFLKGGNGVGSTWKLERIV